MTSAASRSPHALFGPHPIVQRIQPILDIDFTALRALGVYNYEGFQEHRLPEDADFIIHNFLRRRSRNLLVGDSGVGKTPFTADMGIRIAAGLPWIDQSPTEAGTVLYLDGESGEGSFNEMVERLSRHAGLSGVPRNFLFWNPTWSTTPPSANSIQNQVATIIEMVRPSVVFVDPLRVYWPRGDGDDSSSMIEFTTQLTCETGCAWVFTHHLRKRSHEGRPDLEEDPYLYLQESCGALALVNHSDARVGIEPKNLGEADLVVAGFVRGLGKVGPFHIIRDFDDDGEPQGYRLLSGAEHLPSNYRAAFDKLPQVFRFRQAKDGLGGNSSSNAVAMVSRCLGLGLIERQGNGAYRKVDPAK